jgi:lysophospholipase L1-like esterase
VSKPEQSTPSYAPVPTEPVQRLRQHRRAKGSWRGIAAPVILAIGLLPSAISATGAAAAAAPTSFFSLTPASQNATLLSTATVTARLFDGDETPLSNVLIGFRVTAGPDRGRNGSCVPSSCRTDTSGRVKFSITGKGFASGDDTIQAFRDSNANRSPDRGESQATALIHWTLPLARPYVAMGDSFSSGEGVPPYDPASKNDGCDRSWNSYPRLLASKLKDLLPQYVACSGALVRNLYLGQDGEKAQLSSLSTTTKLVTLSIGGNDASFPYILKSCVHQLGTSSDSSCQALGTPTVDNAVTRLQAGYLFCPPNESGSTCVRFPALHDVYARIHHDAPNAQILVLNYPSMFAAKPTKDCVVATAGLAKVTKANQLWMSTQIARVNDVISSEVSIAQKSEVPVSLVPVAARFIGHELCGAKNSSWFNGVQLQTVIVNRLYVIGAGPGSFHPNGTGQSQMKELLIGLSAVKG